MTILLCVGPVVAAPVPKELKKPDDKTLILGKWTMTRCNVGDKVQQSSWKAIVFDADGVFRAVSPAGKTVFDYVTALDPTATPKRMHFQDKQRAVLYDCAYQLAGDALTISVPHDPKQSPASVEPGPKVTVYEFKRADAK